MGSKVLLMFMPLALAMVANSSTTTATFNKTLAHFGTGVGALWTGNIEDNETEMMMMMMKDSETNRLLLNGEKRRYISYISLHQILIPCDQRGQCYCACQRGKPAN
ncbi:hypothetical protein ERO13_A06G210800v2 [Gossypium hirsutum]|uniref:Uncharacterized protein n=4 Tax=Gossypium TaxID=3633 RepID=A0A5J5VHV9_GOSBA|nr:hypothetical protein ES319_A06G218500v1 [Gossypium barbadense]KAG4196920.1 hypothetical protein ERO13_A06G210800v2 [Gossypium hirsutum]TYH14754.1 hypothetical protein ES288_A06G245700v1 [Gossypium darwinii]TYI24513.1 hypothetical protein ES332_A06G239700v1 [Gossypium tomentosum]TYJ31766.1 hypothetical protein E1A91_A06G222300v1 [Gossypium mustelinum]